MHFNPNHDPKSGQFTTGKGGSSIVSSRQSGDEKYQNPDGTLTRKGKKRVRKAMAIYNKMNESATISEKKSSEKKFDKMTYKMTPSELAELTNKVIADQTIRDVYNHNKYQAEELNRKMKSKYDLSPKETVELTNSIINTMGSLSSFYYNYRNNKIQLDTNRYKMLQEGEKAKQESEKAKQGIEKTKQSELKTVMDQQNAFEKGRAYNTAIKGLKNENSNLSSKISGYESQIKSLKEQAQAQPKNETTSYYNSNSTSALMKYSASNYLDKRQADRVNSMMQSDFNKAVSTPTMAVGQKAVNSLPAYTMTDLDKYLSKGKIM